MDSNSENLAKSSISSIPAVNSDKTKPFAKPPPPFNKDAQIKANLPIKKMNPIPLNGMPKPKSKVINFSSRLQKLLKSISQPRSNKDIEESKLSEEMFLSYVDSGCSYMHQLKTLRNKANGQKSSKQVLKEELNLYYHDDELLKQDMLVYQGIDIDSEVEKAMNFTMKIRKDIIHSDPLKTQTLPFTVSLTMGEIKDFKRTPVDIVCLVDNGSGTKSQETLDSLLNGFKDMLERLDEFDRVSVIFFNEKAQRQTPLMRMTKPNKEFILDTIKNMKPQGNVDVGLGLDLAFRVLNRRRFRNPVTSVLLLSSGASEIDLTMIKDNISRLSIKEGVIVNTFGLGKECNSELLTEIAKGGNGKYHFVDDLTLVGHYLAECVENLVCSFARNVQISVKPEPSAILDKVQIINGFENSDQWSYNNTVCTMTMPNLTAETARDFDLEIRIPPNNKELLDHEKSIKIASAECVAIGLNGKSIVQKTELYIIPSSMCKFFV